MLIAFHKPFGVLSQFTGDGSPNRTLAEFGFPKGVWPIGRLQPRHAHEREYWAQVERIPSPESLKKLEKGVLVQGRKTLPCRAWILEPQPEISSVAADVSRLHLLNSRSGLMSAATQIQIPPRHPPIRFRKSVPDCWIGLELIEG